MCLNLVFLCQKPTFKTISDEDVSIFDKTNPTLSYWNGVSFPCNVINLHIWSQKSDGEVLEISDNRNTTITLNEFLPNERLSLKNQTIHLSWDIDTKVYQFDLATPQIQQIMNVVHKYTLTC